ncbi:hypothetical protein [Schleiferilactobacillus shenzhenensis]|uniref:hypothetical protein n=1 Tax=Schleiferilactobacillus shenzhenensis TaxID=1231337 RepID=UPI00042849FA|nr:hypothetical protein [Schleiferilactobacillus shenzhenensis]
MTVEEQLKSLREREVRLLHDSDSARDWYVKDLVKYHFMNERTARRYVDDIAGIDGGLMIAQDTLKRVERETAQTEAQQACTYCHSRLDGSPLSRDDYRAKQVTSVELGAKPFMTPKEINRIEYCQWCGRKLGEPE